MYHEAKQSFLFFFQNPFKVKQIGFVLFSTFIILSGYYTVGRFGYAGVSDYEWNFRIQHIDYGGFSDLEGIIAIFVLSGYVVFLFGELVGEFLVSI